MAGVVGYAAVGAEEEILEKSCQLLLKIACSPNIGYSPIQRSIESLTEILLKSGQGELFSTYFQKFLDYSQGSAYRDPRCCAIRCIGTIAIRTKWHEVHQHCLEHLLHVARSDKEYMVQREALHCLARVVREKLESWALISLSSVSEIVLQSRELTNDYAKHGILQAVMTLIDVVTDSAISNSDIFHSCMKVLLGENMGSIDQEQAMAGLLEALNASSRWGSVPMVMFYEIARSEDVTSVVRGMALDCMCTDFSKKRNELLLDLAKSSPDIDVRKRAAGLCKEGSKTAP